VIRDRVHRLRTASPPGRAAHARLHAESRVSELDSTKLGFGQSAIVCAKRLRIQATWPDLRHLARRPALEGSDLSDAEIVWFQDGAEMLSCLVRDCAAARLERWWWHLLLGGAPSPDLVAERFLLDPASARVAFARLQESFELGRFPSYLGPASVAAVERATRWILTSQVPSKSVTSEQDPPDADSNPQIMSEFFGIAALDDIDSIADRRSGTDGGPSASATGIPGSGRDIPVGPFLANPTISRPDMAPVTASSESVIESVSPSVDRPDSPSRRNPSAPTATSPTANADRLSVDKTDFVIPFETDAPSIPTPVPIAAFKNLLQAASAPDSHPSIAPDPNHQPASDPAPSEAPQHRASVHVHASPAPTFFATEFGGLLFVLDALLALEWIPDFTRPLDSGLGMDPLEYLLRLGHHRFGKRFAQDPLHDWIAGQTNPDLARLPPPRLVELEARIALSLGLRPRRAMHTLCRRRARLRISSGRVDADFRLQDHPLEIRLAGLDRDPGWIPTAGWDIRFQFLVDGA
jgi:hypothetical protein